MSSTAERGEALLAEGGLDVGGCEQVLAALMTHHLDMGELYFQSVRSEAWGLEDGIVKEGTYSADRGVGVRAVSGEKTGFAYADEISRDALDRAALAARGIARHGGAGAVKAFSRASPERRYVGIDPIPTLSADEKVALLGAVDREARAIDPRVKEVSVRIAAVHETTLVIASDGTFAADARPLVRMDVSVIVEANGRRERASSGCGGRRPARWLIDTAQGKALAREAVRQALVNLEAVDAPAGPMPVVLGPGWPGVLLHEAVGHGLEGDFNRKGTSAFAGKVGTRVASPLCTVVDDGTLEHRRGSLTIDDEGTPTRRTVLIENGVLAGYMQDKLNARLMNAVSTGNGRRQSYAHLPMPRMTNTFMLAGASAPEEIVATVKRGLFAVNFGGGQVDITSGKFVFSATEAYLIENGKVGPAVKGATLIGTGADVMTRVSMVGNDLALDHGVGVCGKEGQSIPVGVGQPTLKVDELTVGGTRVG